MEFGLMTLITATWYILTQKVAVIRDLFLSISNNNNNNNNNNKVLFLLFLKVPSD